MEEISLQVSGKDKGLRLDQYLMKNLKLAISRSRIQRLINAGKITVNQRLTKAHYKVKEGDLLLIRIPEEPPVPTVLPEKIPLEIVFEDEDLLVVNKPAGMLTHPAVGNFSGTLVNALLNYGCPLSTINGPNRAGIVHRLDKDTSGLLVIAKNDFAHLNLAQQFQKHTVQRKYIALVKGRVAHDEGEIDYPLARSSQDRRKMKVEFFKKGRRALTRYRVVKRYRDITVLELFPYTGRTHQLRVHLKFCGHPILGDARYGGTKGFTRLALHAVELGFHHPRTHEYVQFHSDLPVCFINFLNSKNKN